MRLLTVLLIAIAISSCSSPFFSTFLPIKNNISAHDGVLNLHNNKFDNFIKLDGQWLFYPAQHIVSEPDAKPRQAVSIHVPSWWNDVISENSNFSNGFGYGSYQLEIHLPDNIVGSELTFYLNHFVGSYRFFINDGYINHKFRGSGYPSPNKDLNIDNPWTAAMEQFIPKRKTITITIEAANFTYGTAGFHTAPAIALTTIADNYFLRQRAICFFTIGTLFVCLLFNLSQIILHQNEKYPLWLIVLCLVSIFNFFHRIFPHMFPPLMETRLFLMSFHVIFLAYLSFVHGATFDKVLPKKTGFGLFFTNFPKALKFSLYLFVFCILFLPSVYILQLVEYYRCILIITISYLVFTSIWFLFNHNQLKNLKTEALIHSISIMGMTFAGIFSLFFHANKRYGADSVSLLPQSIGLITIVLSQTLIVFYKSSILRKQAEKDRQNLKQIQTELVDLNSLKDDFLAKTTHELKTPLHGIIGISEFLVDKPHVDSNTRKDLLSIIYSAQRLSNLVNDLLDATKIKKGTIVLKKISCDLKIAVDSTIDMTAALNRTKKLAIENNIPDELPCVLADEERLLQILQNLIENAIKYTESGSIQITAQPINSDYIECAVIDTGMGIPEKDLDKIFLSFTQGNMNNAGSGLGLSITKNLVELHGGHISVSSKEGTSSTFKFTLPVSSGPSQTKKQGRVVVNKIIPEPTPIFLKSEEHTKNKFKIIAVDDDIINLKVLNNILIESNFQVITKPSGENILEIIRANEPDLVLLDIMMPEVDGFQVCRNIRKYYSIEKLPILFLTAKNQISDLVHGFKLGGNDYIIKPFSKDELLSRIDMHLNLKTANHRLKELCHFSNSIGDTNVMRELIITAGKYLSLDKLVSSVAIFYDGNMIFASDHPMDPKTIKKLIALDGAKEIDIVAYNGSDFLFANLANNYVILCELVKNSAAVYVKNILFQIRAIQNNITKLINNHQVLSSVYRVSKHLNECNYIKGEGKYTRLYTRNNNYFIELQLGQLEVFFYQLLWRVHRSYLINFKNIHRINKNGRGNYHIYFINGESIPVGNKYKNIISQLKAG